MGKTNYVEEALILASAGVSVIPVKTDGSKLPKIKWKRYQEEIMSEKEIRHFFSDCGGVIAITGKVSNLLCIDFDLDKQAPDDDFWTAYMSKVPDHLKEKMLINRTRSGGFHVWLRTDYEDKSRKIAHRPLLIPELYDKYLLLLESGANEKTASKMLLRRPVECVIETRSRGSYGVFVHEQYSRFFGKSLKSFSRNEVDFLLTTAYSLDFNYKKKKVYTGGASDYRVISEFNEDAKPHKVVDMLEKSGLFKMYDIDTNGNYRVSRVGSSSQYSAYVYSNTSCLFVFGMNPFGDSDKKDFTPFEVFCEVNDLEESEAIELIKMKRNV